LTTIKKHFFPTQSTPHLVNKVPDWKEWVQGDILKLVQTCSELTNPCAPL